VVGALVVVEGATVKEGQCQRLRSPVSTPHEEQENLQRLLVEELDELDDALEEDEELLEDDADVVVGAAVVEGLPLVVAGGPPSNWNCGL
jgi:hypothetical protein